jgi:hypothetical protein
MLDSACPAPVAVSMNRAACTYRRRATAAIENTDVPWVYSSGLVGQGRIAVDLALEPDVLLVRRDVAPTVDGDLDDPCWKDIRPVPFQNTPFSMLGAELDFRIFRDAENIYFGYHCRSGPTARGDADEAPRSASDDIEIFIADRGKSAGIHFVIHRSGKATATFGTVETGRKTDPNWQGRWRSAVHETADGWAAELALPIRTLTESGMDLRRLQLNGMAQARTPSGSEVVFLTDPRYGTTFRSCVGFRRVADAPPERPKARPFTVRLHFAEIEDVQPGERVFDVAVQGKNILQDLDIAREAGGKNRALVKELSHVEASEQIVIELRSKGQHSHGSTPPIISGVEVVQEQ